MKIWTEIYTTGERKIQSLDVPDALPNTMNQLNCPLDHYLVNGRLLYRLSNTYRKANQESIIRLPLDHHLEYRCFGGQVKVDFDRGARLQSGPIDSIHTVEEALNHPAYQALVEGIRIAKHSGQKVLTNVTGIYTILSGLKGPSSLARLQGNEIKKIGHSLKSFLTQYLMTLFDLKVDLIHLGDPLVNPPIIGPIAYKECCWTYFSFLQEIRGALNKSPTCLCLHPGLGYMVSERKYFAHQLTTKPPASLIGELLSFKKDLVTVDLQGHINVLVERKLES